MATVPQLTDELDRVNGEQDPTARVQKLRDLRSNLAFLVGTVDRYIGDAELAREGSTIRDVHDTLNARADADARDRLIQTGMIVPEAADAAGLHSHQQLDRAEELGEAFLVRPPARPSRRESVIVIEPVHELAEAPSRPDAGANQPATVDVYARTDPDGGRVYDKTRQDLHRQISDGILRRSRRSDRPTAAIIAGAAGRDKLHDDLHARGRLPENAAHIDHQQIKARLPEFRHMIRDGDPQAHLATHDEAHDIARQTLSEAVRRRANVVISGTGGDVRSTAKHLKRHGYRVEAHYATGSPLVAMHTMLENAGDPSQAPDARTVIPPDQLDQSFKDAAQGLQDAAGSGDIDSLSAYDTDPTYSREVFKDGNVLDDQGWQQATQPPDLPPVEAATDVSPDADDLDDDGQLELDPEQGEA